MRMLFIFILLLWTYLQKTLYITETCFSENVQLQWIYDLLVAMIFTLHLHDPVTKRYINNKKIPNINKL